MVIFIVIYLIGCILSFGRIFAFACEADKKCIKYVAPSNLSNWYIIILIVTLLSWVGFIVGVLIYIIDDEHYFLKYHRLDLWEEYTENNN